MLRIAARVNVQAAETMPEFIRRIRAADYDQLVIVDQRDAPTLAKNAADYLRRYPRSISLRLRMIILLTAAEKPNGEPVCDFLTPPATLREGYGFTQRLLELVKIVLARKRGPVKGFHRKDASTRQALGGLNVSGAVKPVIVVRRRSSWMSSRSVCVARTTNHAYTEPRVRRIQTS
jgi:hypothetical protein